jgi:DNA-directed RNA polymerase specialized sigma24 family protein
VAVRKALKLLSKRDSRVQSQEGIDETTIIGRNASAPMGEEGRAALHRALLQLPERQRLALTYHDLEGKSLEETARLMQLEPPNPKMVSYHRARALKGLRGILSCPPEPVRTKTEKTEQAR